MGLESLLSKGLYTITGERLTKENLGYLGFTDENFIVILNADSIKEINSVDKISPHNHSELSKCTSNNSTVEAVSRVAEENGLNLIILTDHNKIAITEGFSNIKRGTEIRTQYYEFNIIDFSHEDGLKILNVEKAGKYFDFDSVMNKVFELNKNYPVSNRILKGFNHPFSKQIIPFWEKINTKARTGFDFKGYILDHWGGFNKDYFTLHKDFKEKMLDELGINEFVDKYLLDMNYLKDKIAANKFKKHEEIIQHLMSRFDYVEFNTFNYYQKDGNKAVMLANKYDKPVLVDEDTHFLGMIGKKGANLIKKGVTLAEAIDRNEVLPIVTDVYHNPLKNFSTSAVYRTCAGINKLLSK